MTKTAKAAAATLVRVALDAPRIEALSYIWPSEWAVQPERGQWVQVELGRRILVGVVVRLESEADIDRPDLQFKPVLRRLDGIPSLGVSELEFYEFIARYYRRPLGQVLGAVLPVWLRDSKQHQAGPRGTSPFERLIRTGLPEDRPKGAEQNNTGAKRPEHADEAPLTAQQLAALDQLRASAQPSLLWGVTGSGKTRVYLQRIREVLAADPRHQVMVLVPEIALTPQLEDRVRRAFPTESLAVLHSSLNARTRAASWLNISQGKTRIILGTRLAALCPIPGLAMVVIDEEHDASYKQQEGVRYHARDVLVWRCHQRQVPLILASATPSLESWQQWEKGRYQRVELFERATGAARPGIELIDPSRDPKRALAWETEQAIQDTLAQNNQALIFLNRRGWAPVLACGACGWSHRCEPCGTGQVLHRQNGRWVSQCHHCGLLNAIPKACPNCGEQDLAPLGRGLQRVEAELNERFSGARSIRLDRDEIRTMDQLESALSRIRERSVDLIYGTQLVAKGHDFPGLRLVVVLDADAQLSNPDFRASEWLFSLLVQVSGRAGRQNQTDQTPARVLIQTTQPGHRIFQVLQNDTPRAQGEFWSDLLKERAQAGLPPSSHLAAVRLSHRQPETLVRIGEALIAQLQTECQRMGLAEKVRISGLVARYPERQAGVSRYQFFVESTLRSSLHQALDVVEAILKTHTQLETQVEIDPSGLS